MKIRLAIALIFLAALSRLLPHPDNFAPIGAIGIFAAAHFSRRPWLLLTPFIALFISDLALNNLLFSQYFDGFAWYTSWTIHAALLFIMVGGWLLLSNKNITPLRVLGASLTGSVIFFLVTNFGAWMEIPSYPQTPAGLMQAYAAGIPFFGNTLLGDLFYSGVLFGVFAWASRWEMRNAESGMRN
ncbi:MAG: hypothetical protein J0L99_14090 [Chitinophagales bacterium]|nr:hypothetical protein [Chitinophagales bacterium]